MSFLVTAVQGGRLSNTPDRVLKMGSHKHARDGYGRLSEAHRPMTRPPPRLAQLYLGATAEQIPIITDNAAPRRRGAVRPVCMGPAFYAGRSQCRRLRAHVDSGKMTPPGTVYTNSLV